MEGTLSISSCGDESCSSARRLKQRHNWAVLDVDGL